MIIDCARCGVNAVPHGVRAVNKDGRVLELCHHHGTEHADALKKQDWIVVPIATILETQKAGEPA